MSPTESKSVLRGRQSDAVCPVTRLEPAAVQVLPLGIITEIEGAPGQGQQQEGEGSLPGGGRGSRKGWGTPRDPARGGALPEPQPADSEPCGGPR